MLFTAQEDVCTGLHLLKRLLRLCGSWCQFRMLYRQMCPYFRLVVLDFADFGHVYGTSSSYLVGER